MSISFKEIGIEKNILRAADELGFVQAMPIQELVIPYLLGEEQRDIVALAQTGTGKTAAFGIPLIQNTDVSEKSTQHLILCPTRELCIQIAGDLEDYSKYRGDVKTAAVFGGAGIEKQIRQIKKGVHIIAATPGRLLDLIKRGTINLSSIRTVVLDEADEMLNMGFKDDLEAILRETPSERRTLLFSATMPKDVRKIADNYMIDPVEFTVGNRNAGAENIKHVYYTVNDRERYQALKRIVDSNPDVYGIVFCRTRQETKDIAYKLVRDGYNADALHGDLSQPQRDAVMKKFRIKHLRLLVATDVAARGIDIDDLTHIINYNLPDENEVYTHRSGRTGRAGKGGISIAIVTPKQKHTIKKIEKQIGKKFDQEEVPTGKDICEKQLFNFIDRMENENEVNPDVQELLPKVFKKLDWLDKDEIITRFVSLEFNRFLEYYKNSQDLSAPSNNDPSGSRRNSSGNFTRFFMNFGKRDNLTPVRLMGIVNDYTKGKNIEIGKIEILKNFTFFEADSNYVSDIIEGFTGAERKGRELVVEVAGNDGAKPSGRKKKGRKQTSKQRRNNGPKAFKGGKKNARRK